MRIVNKTPRLIAIFFAAACVSGTAQADPVAAPPPATTLAAGDTASSTTSSPPPAPAADMSKTVTAMEDKTTENARSLIKSLDGSDPLTLEDLNRSRQTVARIEAIIEIEKRLAELDKLRSDRAGSSSLANVIPASALSPPSTNTTGAFSKNQIQPPAHFAAAEQPAPFLQASSSGMASGLSVTRIIGADGKYIATLKMADGEVRSVRVGDEIHDATVRWITSSAVVLDEKGKTQTLHVKNVDLVYSSAH